MCPSHTSSVAQWVEQQVYVKASGESYTGLIPQSPMCVSFFMTFYFMENLYTYIYFMFTDDLNIFGLETNVRPLTTRLKL